MKRKRGVDEASTSELSDLSDDSDPELAAAARMGLGQGAAKRAKVTDEPEDGEKKQQQGEEKSTFGARVGLNKGTSPDDPFLPDLKRATRAISPDDPFSSPQKPAAKAEAEEVPFDKFYKREAARLARSQNTYGSRRSLGARGDLWGKWVGSVSFFFPHKSYLLTASRRR
jgi:hypothetical protein